MHHYRHTFASVGINDARNVLMNGEQQSDTSNSLGSQKPIKLKRTQ